MFSVKLDKQDEDDQVLDEVELYINLNINNNLIESDIKNNDVRSQLEHHSQNQESKDIEWRIDEVI